MLAIGKLADDLEHISSLLKLVELATSLTLVMESYGYRLLTNTEVNQPLLLRTRAAHNQRVGVPFTNQHLATYSSAGSPYNKDYFTARNGQSDKKSIPRALGSQSGPFTVTSNFSETLKFYFQDMPPPHENKAYSRLENLTKVDIANEAIFSLDIEVWHVQKSFREIRVSLCIEPIFNLNTTLKYKLLRNSPTICSFVDFETLADDLAMQVVDETTAIKQRATLKEYAESVDLQISFQKTHFICSKLPIQKLITKYGQIESDPFFKYLGEILEPTGEEKIAQKGLMRKLGRACGRTYIIYKKKVCLYTQKSGTTKTVIKHEALYASEPLTLHRKGRSRDNKCADVRGRGKGEMPGLRKAPLAMRRRVVVAECHPVNYSRRARQGLRGGGEGHERVRPVAWFIPGQRHRLERSSPTFGGRVPPPPQTRTTTSPFLPAGAPCLDRYWQPALHTCLSSPGAGRPLRRPPTRRYKCVAMSWEIRFFYETIPHAPNVLIYENKTFFRASRILAKRHLMRVSVSPLAFARSCAMSRRVGGPLKAGLNNSPSHLPVVRLSGGHCVLTAPKLRAANCTRNIGSGYIVDTAFVLREYVYVDALGRLDVYVMSPAPLHSIIWSFMGITGLLLRSSFQPMVANLKTYSRENGSICGSAQLEYLYGIRYGTVLVNLLVAPRTMSQHNHFSDMLAAQRKISPVSPAFAFRRCSILTSLHPHWLSRPHVKSLPNVSTPRLAIDRDRNIYRLKDTWARLHDPLYSQSLAFCPSEKPAVVPQIKWQGIRCLYLCSRSRAVRKYQCPEEKLFDDEIGKLVLVYLPCALYTTFPLRMYRMFTANYRQQYCTPVQCFARRGDERCDAHVSVAPSAPALLSLKSAKFLQLGGHLIRKVLRADEDEARGIRKPTCDNPGPTPPGIEPGSSRWEASSLTVPPPRPPTSMSVATVHFSLLKSTVYSYFYAKEITVSSKLKDRRVLMLGAVRN
ncbi:hypothetical protein PR048_007410 [Dryococelus australis]|uniref:Uncharacterized protein n=1 Tax=Dryococelus australis TaxID=614101 RepID=A0ABQ9HU62_9NEOP|nr:hypothetical protein PR048_007410 [Dryococelus australis]